jgi:hypothetical protein
MRSFSSSSTSSTIVSPPDVGIGFALTAHHAACWTATNGFGALANPAGAAAAMSAKRRVWSTPRRLTKRTVRPSL